MVKYAFADVGRADHKNVGLTAAPGLHGFGLGHQALHAKADTGRVGGKALLGVVGAQHNNQQIHRLVAHQTGIDRVQTGHGLLQGVRKHGGAPGEPLLDHKVILSQCLLQQTGPAFVLVETVAAIGTVGGVGAVAVGVGITETDNVFFHLYFTSGREAAAADWPTRRKRSSGRAMLILPQTSGYSLARTFRQVSSRVSPPLPDMTRPRSSTLRKP